MTEVRVVVRPYASSLPIGFFAFGIGMLLLGGLSLGWLHPSERHTVEDVRKAAVLPVFRRGTSKESFEGDLQVQLRELADEAGVRKTL